MTASELQPVKQVQALDRYTIRLILSAPNRPLLGGLANVYTGIVDPRAIRAEGDAFCQAPVGSSPFKVQRLIDTLVLADPLYTNHDPGHPATGEGFPRPGRPLYPNFPQDLFVTS